MSSSQENTYSQNLDALISAVDVCRDDEPQFRRSCLDAHLRERGLMIHTREMIASLFDRCRFFESGPMKGWLERVFPGHASDPEERILRTVEEVMELAQTENVTRDQLHALVDQVMDKPVGDKFQELGGTMVTLGSYCAVTGLDAAAAFSEEFGRCNRPEVIVKIQAKHRAKAVVSSKLRR